MVSLMFCWHMRCLALYQFPFIILTDFPNLMCTEHRFHRCFRQFNCSILASDRESLFLMIEPIFFYMHSIWITFIGTFPVIDMLTYCNLD